MEVRSRCQAETVATTAGTGMSCCFQGLSETWKQESGLIIMITVETPSSPWEHQLIRVWGGRVVLVSQGTCVCLLLSMKQRTEEKQPSNNSSRNPVVKALGGVSGNIQKWGERPKHRTSQLPGVLSTWGGGGSLSGINCLYSGVTFANNVTFSV